MTKHTPGPWRISRETTRGEFVTDTRIRAANGDHIALIGPCEIDANANLIVNAPDTLDTLTTLVREVEKLPIDWEKHRDLTHARHAARIQIGKAKGILK